MIHYLKRSEVNIVKYDACIEKSSNSRIYAFSWYLDCVADNWDVLILDDYEAVMPLPWRQKYFIKYIYPPAWTQQLGVFSKNSVSQELLQNFIKSIPRKFKKVTIQFNSENKLNISSVQQRANYILPLNDSYEVLFNKFNKGRKYSIDKANKTLLELSNCSIDKLIEICKKEYSFLKISENDFNKLINIVNQFEANKKGFLVGVFSENNDCLGGVVFLKEAFRIYYLFSVASDEGKKQQITSLILNSIIKKYANSNYLLDFEGSMIKGVANFYKSFEAEVEIYSSFNFSRFL